jgi:hypothetical protein
MKRIIATALLVATTGSAIVSGTANALDAAPATPASPAVSTTSTGTSAMDPETQRLITLLATSVLAQFAAQASTGTLKDFDPGPMMESALRGALDSGAINKLIDRLVDQAGSSINANGTADNAALTPEMRALIKVALSGAVMVAKNEITRSLKEDLQPAPAPQAKPTPQSSSVLNKDEGRN